jgi:hypothetical protein
MTTKDLEWKRVHILACSRFSNMRVEKKQIIFNRSISIDANKPVIGMLRFSEASCNEAKSTLFRLFADHKMYAAFLPSSLML